MVSARGVAMRAPHHPTAGAAAPRGDAADQHSVDAMLATRRASCATDIDTSGNTTALQWRIMAP